MIDIFTSYEQNEAQKTSKYLHDMGIPNEIEEASASLQAYAPAMVSYIIKVDKEVEKRANDIIDDLFDHE